MILTCISVVNGSKFGKGGSDEAELPEPSY
jgi:hypothetical protein